VTHLVIDLNVRSRKLRLTTVGDPPRGLSDTLLSTKVGTKFRRQVAVAQSVYFVCGLRATEFILMELNAPANGKRVNAIATADGIYEDPARSLL
jgi:hypothetical protein